MIYFAVLLWLLLGVAFFFSFLGATQTITVILFSAFCLMAAVLALHPKFTKK